MKPQPVRLIKPLPCFQPARLPTGTIRQSDQAVEWTVWAPYIEQMELVIVQSGGNQAYPMQKQEEYHRLRLDEIEDGLQYLLRLPDGDFPDPASRWQPEGVYGPSAVITLER